MLNKKPKTNFTTNSDLRYFPRWVVDDSVSYCPEGEQEFYKGRTKDLSCAGACIVGKGHIAPRQKISVNLELSKETIVKLNAYTLWVKIESDRCHTGVSFYDTPDEVQDLILKHAFEINKDKVVNNWFKGWKSS